MEVGTRAPAQANPLREGLRLERTPQPCALVIFGATGDLTKRKLLPALLNLAQENVLPQHFAIIGAAVGGACLNSAHA